MFNRNGKIYMVKNIWQRCKQIWTHCFFVASYYVVSYYRFLNTDPAFHKALHTLHTALHKALLPFVYTTSRFHEPTLHFSLNPFCVDVFFIKPGLPDGRYLFKQKIPIWVNYGVS
jgi:hypothetical protein